MRGAQTKLAKKTGFTDSYISQILSGSRSVGRLETSKKLGSAIERDPFFFMTADLSEIRQAVNEYFAERGDNGQAA